MKLTEATTLRVQRMFPAEAEAVAELLREHCGPTLPLVAATDPKWTALVERVRFAVLRLSCGDRTKLDAAIASAHVDWRDVLLAAGFGGPDAHLQWDG